MKLKKRQTYRRLSAITAAMLFAVCVFASSFCYADDFQTRTVRDGSLFLTVPETWQIEETGDLDDDSAMVDSGEYTFRVLDLQDGDGVKQAEMWIYADPYDNGYYYCDTVEDADNYFDESGSYALDSIIEAAFPDAGTWNTVTEYIKGEDDFTYVVRSKANIDGNPYVIYLSCDFVSDGGVHEALIFEGEEGLATSDRIGESVEGYGYAVELIDNRDHTLDGGDNSGIFGDDDMGIDMEDLFSAFIWIAVWAAIVFFVVKKAKGMRRPEGAKTARRVLGQSQPVRTRSARKAVDKWVFKESKPVNRDHTEHEDCQIQGGTRYTGYRESLKTLHKSGLLTTKEMNELLEKHKYDI